MPRRTTHHKPEIWFSVRKPHLNSALCKHVALISLAGFSVWYSIHSQHLAAQLTCGASIAAAFHVLYEKWF